MTTTRRLLERESSSTFVAGSRTYIPQHQNPPQMILNEDEGGEDQLEQQQQDDLAEMLENQVNQAVAPSYPHLQQLKLTGFRFKPDEMRLLCHFLQKGNNLKTVAIFTTSPCHWNPIFPNVDLFNQYHQLWMSKEIVLSSYSPQELAIMQEDDILRQQISLHGTENWAIIASKFNDKTTRQCRRRMDNAVKNQFTTLCQKRANTKL
ncbi:Transcription factor MYB88 [Linum perenne]